MSTTDRTPDPPGSRPHLRGVEVDAEGRCAHWQSPVDIVSFRFPCCDGFWACRDCHEALADHPARPWPRGSGEELAVLCGGCRSVLTVAAYRSHTDACPVCGATFNPRCRLHHPRYFLDASSTHAHPDLPPRA